MSRQLSLSIVHPWDPWSQTVGGSEACIDGILRALPAGWPVEVIGTTADVEARPVGRWLDTEFEGRPVRFFAVLSNWPADRAHSIPLSFRFMVACRRYRVRASGRIIEYHRFESGLAVSCSGAQRPVYFFHNHPPEAIRPNHNGNAWRNLPGIHDVLLLQRVRRATLIVAVDPRTPAWLSSHLPDIRDRITLLPEWADPGVFNPGTEAERKEGALRLRRSVGLPAESRVVLFAGRLEPQKDPLLLLDAFAILAKEKPDVSLLIVGEGGMASQVDLAIRRVGLAERTRRMSSVNRKELAGILRASDVVAVTSAFEGGPRTAFEALACGTPVVTFDVGQIGLLLDRTPGAGVLVRDRTDTAFAAGLGQALAWQADPGLPGRCVDAVRSHVPERALAELIRRYQVWGQNRG